MGKGKIKTIKFPAKDLKVGDVVLIDSKPRVVLSIDDEVYIVDGCEAIKKVGLVDLVKRASTNEYTYIQFKNQVHKLLKEQGVSRPPGREFIRPYYNIGAGTDECAAAYLSKIELPEV